MAVYEIVVWAAPSKGPGQAQQGDIIAIRKPGKEIGKKEGSLFLWLRVDLPDDIDPGSLIEPGDGLKRRWSIPLDKLKEAAPSLDLTKATDEKTLYQPFLSLKADLSIDEAKTASALTQATARSLIVDKTAIVAKDIR